MDEMNVGTAKSKIDCLLDAYSFVEVGCHIRHESSEFGLEHQAPGDGVVAGYGTINAVPVYIYAQDRSAFAGSLGAKNAEKIARVYDAAVKNGLPIIALLDSAGARLKEGVAALDGYAKIMKSAAKASGVIPQIAVVCGPCVGAASLISQLSDFVFLAEEGAVAVTAPAIQRASLGADGATSPLVYDDKAEMPALFEDVKKLLEMLPSNCLEDAPLGSQEDDFNRVTAESGDIRTLIANAADYGEFLELKKHAAGNIVTGFARFGGMTAGVVANAPGETEGRLDIAGLKKAAGFVSFCDSFNLPVVTLVDTPGFVLSAEEEQRGLPTYAAQLAYAYAQAEVPLISVVAGKAIGGAYSILASHEIGVDMTLALKGAQIAPIAADTASVIFFGDDIAKAEDPQAARAQKIEEYAKKWSSPMEAAYYGSVDRVIECGELRQMLISSLIMQATKHAGKSPKRHGNLPL